MPSIIEEFGKERVQKIIEKSKKIEKVGVLRILPFLSKEPKYFITQFDDVLSLHALKPALKIAEDLGWVEIQEGIRGRKYPVLTDAGVNMAELFSKMLES